jgi:hypothetical protein
MVCFSLCTDPELWMFQQVVRAGKEARAADVSTDFVNRYQAEGRRNLSHSDKERPKGHALQSINHHCSGRAKVA